MHNQLRQDKSNVPELFEFVVELYEEAIRKGSDYAMNDLGALYYDGKECRQDFTKTVYYYEMAAAHGNCFARENLGYCYYYGRGIPVDYEKAFQYYAYGAFCRRLRSLYKIGDMYRNGYYVEKNSDMAFRIYMRCIDMMDPPDEYDIAGPVYLRLGRAYFYGEGTEKDFSKALKCFQKAERYLYNMVAEGEEMYLTSLHAAIDGQEKTRRELMKNLPSPRWPQE